MRIPPFSRYRPLMRMTAVFVLGAIAGSIVYNGIFHLSYNKLWLTNQELQLRLHQNEKDIITLKKYSKRQTVIKEIKVLSEESDNGPDQAALKIMLQKLGDELEVLRGRDVFNIDEYSKMTRIMLNQKTYTVREKQYSVQVKTMLVMEGVLHVWVQIRLHVPT
ncbi:MULTISPECIES: cytochrome b-c1 complex subunit 9 [Paenibacillus]|uniref:cytochrome b-c1 complex subunit 9 n=1 Tax=Paenibacillus TaxID=44249 RepID=UPI001F3DBA1A|nr:cytochrome b-c1 complex subunit 9 [Paenibacillus sp. JJ-223]